MPYKKAIAFILRLFSKLLSVTKPVICLFITEKKVGQIRHDL